MTYIDKKSFYSDLYPRLLTGPTEDNMIVTDLYPRLLTGPTEVHALPAVKKSINNEIKRLFTLNKGLNTCKKIIL